MIKSEDDRRRYHRRLSLERRELIRFDLRRAKRRSGGDRRLLSFKSHTEKLS